MNQIRHLCCFSLLFLLVACGGNKSNKIEDAKNTTQVTTLQDDTYKEMAEEHCACMRPMADLYKKIKELSAAGNVDDLSDLMDELENTSESADDCTDSINEKHGEPENDAEFKARFRQECPQVAALIAEMEEED